MRRLRFREVKKLAQGHRAGSTLPSMSLFSRLFLALLSSSCVTLDKSICLSEPIYVIYKMGLIVFTYLTSGCGASTRWGV